MILPDRTGRFFRRSSTGASSGPRQQRLVDAIKARTNAKVWYHTCGDCSEYIPDLIDMGVDILNPVQISAPGMDPTMLKRKYGDNLVFWGGGIDSQHILPFAPPARSKQKCGEIWRS